MILLVGNPKDCTLVEFKDFLNQQGAIVEHVYDISTLQFLVSMDTQGQSKGYIQIDNTKIELGAIQGVINRWIPKEENGFVTLENQASLWGLFGLISSCPIINKPSPIGFLPFTEAICQSLLLNHTVWSIPCCFSTEQKLVLGSFKQQNDTIRATEILSWQQIALGQETKSGRPNSEKRLLRYTAFDPQKTQYFLYVGKELINLTYPHNPIQPETQLALKPILDQLTLRHAYFSWFVLDGVSSKEYRLIHVDILPQISLYQHVKDRVHNALADFFEGKSE